MGGLYMQTCFRSMKYCNTNIVNIYHLYNNTKIGPTSLKIQPQLENLNLLNTLFFGGNGDINSKLATKWTGEKKKLLTFVLFSNLILVSFHYISFSFL